MNRRSRIATAKIAGPLGQSLLGMAHAGSGRSTHKLVCLAVFSLMILSPSILRAQDLFVSAASANAVYRFDGQTGEFLGQFVSSGAGGLVDPNGLAFGPDGNLYVASHGGFLGANQILRFDGQTGSFLDVFATTAGMTYPAEINFHDHYLYVSDFGSGVNRVSRFDASTGAFVDHFATGIARADGQSWDSNGDLIVSGANRVARFDGQTGAYLDDLVDPGVGGLGLALDNLFLPDGTFLVSDYVGNAVRHYDANGQYLGAPIGLSGPQGLQLGPDGELYAGSYLDGLIHRYDSTTFQWLGEFASTGGMSTTNNFVFGPTAVPEPGTAWCLGIAAVTVLLRRVRKSLD